MATQKPIDETFTLSFTFKNLAFALVALNILTLFLWRPWVSSTTAERTISVNGETVIEAEPDEFIFSPSYRLTGSSKDAVLDKAVKKANEVVDGLKKLGVEDKDIKLDTSSYETWWYQDDDGQDSATVSLTVTVNDRDFAQEVQDFLVDTNPEGQISPWSTFSDDRQNKLESQARTEAVADAKNKAEQSARELGVKVGKVVSISEGSGFGGYPIAEFATAANGVDEDVSSSLPIQPGENEYNFSVTVVFELK